MAYCKVAASRACNAALSYGEKRQGQEREGVVKNGVNCDIENAKTEMRSVRESWQKNGGVQAHVLIQSFKGQELSPEQANEIGQELAEKVAPGHQAAVYTHVDADGGNVHNHIVINSVNPENGRKLESHNLLKDTRQASDELCRERGLSIIRERSAGLRYTQAEQGLNKRGLDSWKDEIREIVDDAKKQARTPEEFRQHLSRYNVGMTERGKDRKITYQHPNGRKVRAARLGNDYERPAIEKALQVERPAVSRSAERPREIPKTLEGVEQEHKRRMDSITKPKIEAARRAAEQKRAAERAAREKRLQQERQQPHKHKRNLSIEPPSHGRSGGRGGMER